MDQHRVALVTGGTRGIGAAIIGALAADDIHVAAGYSRNRGAADDMAANLAVAGHSVSLHQGNVGVPEDCERVVAEVLDRVVAGIPMRRLGHPDEIAHAVRFLLQDGAGYITGSVLSVNGGMEM